MRSILSERDAYHATTMIPHRQVRFFVPKTGGAERLFLNEIQSYAKIKKNTVGNFACILYARQLRGGHFVNAGKEEKRSDR